MDLSYSMKDDLENVKNLGTSLMQEMSNITSDFRIGECFLRAVAKECFIAVFVFGSTCRAAVPCAHTPIVLDQMLPLRSDIYGPAKTNFSPHLFCKGFGSFVEKTVMPYISTTPAKLLNPCTGDQNCTSPFSYKHVLNLTKDGKTFNTLVGQQQISGNLDSPEGGFDAIMQVAVCEVSSTHSKNCCCCCC